MWILAATKSKHCWQVHKQMLLLWMFSDHPNDLFVNHLLICFALIWRLIHLEKIKVTYFSQLTLYQNCKVTWQDTLGGTSAGLRASAYTAQQKRKINVEIHGPCGIHTHDSNVQAKMIHAAANAVNDWATVSIKSLWMVFKHTNEATWGGAIK